MQPSHTSTVFDNNHPQATHASGHPPRVWLVRSYRAGENAQIQALADALGWPHDTKQLAYRFTDFIPGLLRSTGLTGINVAESSPLAPPWPDLIISAGMRNEPVVRWIKQQSHGKTRLAHIGRPWADYRHFDLLITTPQYRLPMRSNVLHNTLTMHRVTDKRLAESAQRCITRLAHLPSPYTTVIVGGHSGPYTLGAKAARRLATWANAMAQEARGSLLVTTSKRTSRAASEALRASLDAPHYFYEWTNHATDNPYYGLLGLASNIVVTGDSVSMLTEACATGKPVYIFDLGTGKNSMRKRSAASQPTTNEDDDFRLGGFLYQQLARFGPQRLSRDLSLVHQALTSSGRAVWLGDTFTNKPSPASQDIDNAVARVHALFAEL